jgi:AbiJ N-terminal domain 4
MSPREPRFSERYGYVPAPVLQVGSMTDGLRNSIWNLFCSTFDNVAPGSRSLAMPWSGFARAAAYQFFDSPVDEVPTYEDWLARDWIKARFGQLPWNEVYELVEFALQVAPYIGQSHINTILERHVAGYRVIAGKVAPITSPAEIAAITEALDASQRGGLEGVHAHLLAATDLLSKKPTADYRNAIKEAISAVESMVNVITGTKTTLGKALELLERKGITIHSALKGGFDKLYGYTNDSDGIRHAIIESPDAGFDEAKFMIVSCSAFVNWLIAKAAKAGVLGNPCGS